jgi:hypothetical protein
MKKALATVLLLLAASAVNAAPREDRQRVQDARYKVIEVLKGETKATEFSLGFTIEFGVPFVELKESRLSPEVFASGKRHVLFLKTDPATRPLEKSRLDGALERRLTPAEHYGLMEADSETVSYLQQFISGASRENQEVLQRLVERAEIVVVAEIAEVLPSPNFWSGFVRSAQSVDYRVIEVLKGDVRHRELRIDFLLSQDSPFVDPFEPHLLPEVFKPGTRQLHFLKRRGGGTYFKRDRGKFESFSDVDHLWSTSSTPNAVNYIRQLILTPPNAKL